MSNREVERKWLLRAMPPRVVDTHIVRQGYVGPARIRIIDVDKENSIYRTPSYKLSRMSVKRLFLKKKLKMIGLKDNAELLGKFEIARSMSMENLEEVEDVTMDVEGGKGISNYIMKKLDHIRDYDKKHMFVMSFIQERVKKVIDVENIDVTQPLASYGLSSLMAEE